MNATDLKNDLYVLRSQIKNKEEHCLILLDPFPDYLDGFLGTVFFQTTQIYLNKVKNFSYIVPKELNERFNLHFEILAQNDPAVTYNTLNPNKVSIDNMSYMLLYVTPNQSPETPSLTKIIFVNALKNGWIDLSGKRSV